MKKLPINTPLFIEKARRVHGDKYDYSKVEYVKANLKVCIICPEHGDYWQTPNEHINGGCGCPICARSRIANSRTLSTEEFITKARDVHGDKYDYSKVEYIKSSKKVCIICPEHGEFWQTPNSHLSRGNGCPFCGHIRTANSKMLSSTEFIRRSKEVHGDKYNYSKVEYVKSDSNVCIVCPEHGEFWQSPCSHMSGHGCPECGFVNTAKKKRMSKSEFVRRADKIHYNKYDYSKVVYSNADTKVCIICPEHGEFWQTPAHHISRGDGCPICRYKSSAKTKTFTTQKFIDISKDVHGDKYDYSETTYTKAKLPLVIICPLHGKFSQIAMDHMSGQGCPKCGRIRTIEARRNTVDEFIDKAKKIHGDKYGYSKVEYVNNRTPVQICCPKHGDFEQTPHEHLSGCGCPKCFDSSLERELIKLFDEKMIKYEYQKKFLWMGRQSLDFYLPDYNIAIECQGLQHYVAAEGYMGGEKGFRIRQGLDIRKRRLCNEHGVRIIYYDHTNFDKFLGEQVIKTQDQLLSVIKEYQSSINSL